ncbi:MAG: 30S ribosomal protein S17 [Candidatus Brocadiae bacterium]|nr:30S ribosomal protein S17 [Candidatus Brocadiia bacterium]
MERSQRKNMVGVVTSDKMQKTIVISVERLVKHPRYKKYVHKYTTLKAHDEKSEAKVGDQVEIMQTRPLSKTKNWRLVKVLKAKGSE